MTQPMEQPVSQTTTDVAEQSAQPVSVPIPDIRPLLDDDLKVLVPAACKDVGDLATVVQIQFLREWSFQKAQVMSAIDRALSELAALKVK